MEYFFTVMLAIVLYLVSSRNFLVAKDNDGRRNDTRSYGSVTWRTRIPIFAGTEIVLYIRPCSHCRDRFIHQSDRALAWSL
jgi:hypothetical protein